MRNVEAAYSRFFFKHAAVSRVYFGEGVAFPWEAASFPYRKQKEKDGSESHPYLEGEAALR
jgi:hypothetical protein